MRYQIVAIDLDGTLLRTDGLLSPVNRSAIEDALAHGVRIVPCTGRVWHRAHHVVLRHLPPMEMGIFANGGAVHDIASGKMHLSITLGVVAILRTLEICHDLPVLYQLCMLHGDNYGYQISNAQFRPLLLKRWHNEADGSGRFHPTMRLLDELDLDALTEAILIRVVTDDGAVFDELVRRLAPAAHTMGAFVLPYSDDDGALCCVELYSDQMNKWVALERLGRQLGVKSDQIAAIGDHINDIEMITHAGCGVAVANALPSVLKAARYVTLSNDNDGVAHALRKMLASEW